MPDIQQYSVSVKFKTEGADKAANDTDKVKKSVSSLKSSTAGMKNLTSGLKTIGTGIGKVTKVFSAVTVAGVTMFAKLGKSAFNYSKQMSDYIETINLFRTSMGSATSDAEKFRDKAQEVLGLDPSVTMDALSSFQNLSEGFGIASDRAYIMSKNLTQLAGDLSSFANISYDVAKKNLMSGFSGQVLPLRKYGIALDQASLQELAYSLGIDKRVKSMTRAQKSELIYYQIMKSTQKMQGDLARTIMSPANALRLIKTEFTSLARAVGSIFIPIMVRIIPIMRAVTKALTSAAQAIAAFFGFKMKDFTSDLGGVGDLLTGISDDVDDVGGAAEGTAKKLNKMLMPFDELNNITSDNKSGSGGGAGGADIDGGSLGIDLPTYDMFEGLDERIFNFENILGKAKETAEKINELLAGIDWETIKEEAQQIGANIGKFVNIGITDIDWYLVGQTLAESINTLVASVNGFLKEIDFIQLRSRCFRCY